MAFAHKTYEEYLSHQLNITKGPELFLDKQSQEEAIIYLLNGYNRNTKILDVGCGSAVGLSMMKSMKFPVCGLDVDPKRAELCRMMGFDVRHGDMCDMPFEDGEVDLIYSSHSFEHARDPAKALSEFLRVATESIIIVPYPDFGDKDQHPATGIIRTNISREFDGGQGFLDWLKENGAHVIQYWLWPIGMKFVRQDEIWVKVSSAA